MSEILIGFTDRTELVFIPDPASTDGSGKTGLVAANLTVSYTRVETDNDVVVTDATSSLNNLGALTSAHNDWGLLEVSSTLAPGLYRLDIADAVFASGAWSAVVYVMITTSAAAASPMKFDLVAFNPLDGVRLGLTALPNAAADAAGGLPISDAGGLDLDAKIGALTYGTANRVNAQVFGMEANVLTATAINADAITAAKLHADVTTELQSGLATAANLATVAGYIDTEVASILAAVDTEIATLQTSVDDLPTNAELATALGTADDAVLTAINDLPTNAELATALGTADDAVLAQVALVKTETDKIASIKTKTDSLTFTVAGNVDANAQYVNDTQLEGDGSAIPWGPV